MCTLNAQGKRAFLADNGVGTHCALYADNSLCGYIPDLVMDHRRRQLSTGEAAQVELARRPTDASTRVFWSKVCGFTDNAVPQSLGVGNSHLTHALQHARSVSFFDHCASHEARGTLTPAVALRAAFYVARYVLNIRFKRVHNQGPPLFCPSVDATVHECMTRDGRAALLLGDADEDAVYAVVLDVLCALSQCEHSCVMRMQECAPNLLQYPSTHARPLCLDRRVLSPVVHHVGVALALFPGLTEQITALAASTVTAWYACTHAATVHYRMCFDILRDSPGTDTRVLDAEKYGCTQADEVATEHMTCSLSRNGKHARVRLLPNKLVHACNDLCMEQLVELHDTIVLLQDFYPSQIHTTDTTITILVDQKTTKMACFMPGMQRHACPIYKITMCYEHQKVEIDKELFAAALWSPFLRR